MTVNNPFLDPKLGGLCGMCEYNRIPDWERPPFCDECRPEMDALRAEWRRPCMDEDAYYARLDAMKKRLMERARTGVPKSGGELKTDCNFLLSLLEAALSDGLLTQAEVAGACDQAGADRLSTVEVLCTAMREGDSPAKSALEAIIRLVSRRKRGLPDAIRLTG